MNNRIVYVSEEEAQKIKKCSMQDRDIFFAEIDGEKIRTEADYVQAISEAFDFPNKLPTLKMEWCNDYISDLMWIEQKDIVLIVHKYNLMLCEELKLKKIIVDDFEEIILPWWEGEIVGHMVGGKPRGFLVYLEQ